MPDLIAVAAYGKTQSLTDAECLDLFDRVSRLRWEPTLAQLAALTFDVKRERNPAPMPEARTHEQWQAEREGVVGQPRTWVCDGCMASVKREQVADMADGEHVICQTCVEQPQGDRLHASMCGRRVGSTFHTCLSYCGCWCHHQ